MAIQAIVYSAATGRVRRVIDPEIAVASVAAFIAEAQAHAGEGVLVYTKIGNGADTLGAWQAAVNAHTGLAPDTGKTDWYCEVDAQNTIVDWHIADPLCGDTALASGATLINAPWGADSRWTYNGQVFTAPVLAVKTA